MSRRFRVVHERVESQEPDERQLERDHDVTVRGSRLTRSISSSKMIEEVEDTLIEGFRVSSFIARMAMKLASFVGFSWFAWMMFTRLILFAILLLPGFMRIVWRYLFSKEIVRDFYGLERRQSLDIYCSKTSGDGQEKKPVIIFFAGGAWIIGYKAWGAFLGFCYSQLGYVVVTPDYRNFPQVTIEKMISDVDLAIDWCVSNIAKYGGDSSNIVLMGQSAGAHLASVVVLKGVGRLNRTSVLEENDLPRWKLKDIKGFIGISGPYNLSKLCPHLNKRGLNTALLRMLFRGNYEQYSPTFLAKKLHKLNGEERVPCPIPITLIHGTADVTCPHTQSEELYDTLSECFCMENDAILSLELMNGLTHTDPIIELPMRGRDPLMERTVVYLEKMSRFPCSDLGSVERLLPDFLIEAARFVNPF